MNNGARSPFASRWARKEARILKMVLRQGLGLAAAGAGLGLAGALIVSHLMAGLLYGVSPYDLSTFAGVTACAHRCRPRRQLCPCAARHAPRSDHYTPLRMTSWHCSGLVFASVKNRSNICSASCGENPTPNH